MSLNDDWLFDTNELTMFDNESSLYGMDVASNLFETPSEPCRETLPEFIQFKEQEISCVDSSQPAGQIRKPKARILRDSDWEPHRDRIIELYTQPKMSMQAMQRILLAEEDFFAE